MSLDGGRVKSRPVKECGLKAIRLTRLFYTVASCRVRLGYGAILLSISTEEPTRYPLQSSFFSEDVRNEFAGIPRPYQRNRCFRRRAFKISHNLHRSIILSAWPYKKGEVAVPVPHIIVLPARFSPCMITELLPVNPVNQYAGLPQFSPRTRPRRTNHKDGFTLRISN